MDTREFYTVQQLADRWGCSADHCYHLISTGTLPAVDISLANAARRRWVVSREAIEQFEHERTATTHEPLTPTARRRRRPQVTHTRFIQ